MDQQPPSAVPGFLIGVLIVAAVAVGGVAVLWMDPWGEQRSRPKPEEIPLVLIEYEQAAAIPIDMQEVRAIAVGPDDRIYVAGDRAIHVFDPGGRRQREIQLENEPRCLAVAGPNHAFPGRIYVGMADHVEVLDADGTSVATWAAPREEALLTSIATAEADVFVADAGNRIVWRCDPAGTVRGKIGEEDAARGIPGFAITSPHFDLAVGPTGDRLHVVNPRLLRIETYSFDGELKSHWGEASEEIEGFYGCCNPAHFTMLSDGRFVTAEKGKPRVKVHGAEGAFRCVVAGPQQVDVTAADVAADSQDRVLILDPVARSVRVFIHKDTQPGGQP
ncbi:MAG TPA: hypothetical protein VMY42_05365 [Thermoguttaceae bacterium]|nr:hypothetical protein [Thermoguttaceae bacterium]